jgi:ribosome-interacting GTPase 1
MSDERQRILAMIAQGKISVQEAEKLLDALNSNKGESMNTESGATVAGVKRNVKFLRVVIESKEKDNVNVRVPMSLLRAGLRLSALIPPIAYQKINEKMAEKGIEFDINQFLKGGDIEELIESMSELNVDVNSAQGDLVKVFFE